MNYLGYYQIVGGGIGIAIIIVSIMSSVRIDSITIILFGLFSLFFGYSILCGILCVRHHKAALSLSFINQLLQILTFAAAGFGFSYAAGIYVTIGLDLSNDFELNFGAGISRLRLFLFSDKSILDFEFNIVAIFFVFWILSLIKKVKTETAITSQFSDWK